MSIEHEKDGTFGVLNQIILGIGFVLCLYPLYFVVIASFSDPNMVNVGKVILFPRGLTLDGYREVLAYSPLWKGYLNTLIYTVSGTLISASMTISAGYALSRKDMPGRNFFTIFFSFTMIFSGGLIPRFLLVKNLGMINTMWAMVLPNAVIVFYLIMARSFFQSTIPQDLIDAAKIDGCGNLRFFFTNVIPLSSAIIAIVCLYYAVFQWNSFFDAFLFLSNRDKHPIQLVLRDLIIQNESASMETDPMAADEKQRLANLIKYGAIVFSTLPILMFYPFLQRYFVKGVMIGSIKG
jgi:putative aldouronate transport system permease protein